MKKFKFKKFGIDLEMNYGINKEDENARNINELITVSGESFKINRAYKTKPNEFMHVKNDCVLTFEIGWATLKITPKKFKLKDVEGNVYPYYFTKQEDEPHLLDKETNKIHFDVKNCDHYHLIFTSLENNEILINVDNI